jgi:hypothetical protein
MARQQLFLEQANSGTFPRKSNLPLVVAATAANLVIKCGGGSGWISRFLEKKVTYFNLELPSVAQYFQQIVNIDFITDTDGIDVDNPKAISVLYSNSTMQYFADQKNFDQIVSSTDCDFILIDEVLLSEGMSHYTLQEYYGQKLVVFFETHSNLLNRFLRNGYSICADIPYEFNVNQNMEFTIFDESVSEIVPISPPRSMLFRKINTIIEVD